MERILVSSPWKSLTVARIHSFSAKKETKTVKPLLFGLQNAEDPFGYSVQVTARFMNVFSKSILLNMDHKKATRLLIYEGTVVKQYFSQDLLRHSP